MMAVIAEGRNFDRDDTLADAKVRGCPILCPLKVEDIGKEPKPYVKQTRENTAGPAQEMNKETVANKLTMSMQSARIAARRLVESQRQNAADSSGEHATKRCLKMSDFKTDHTAKIDNVKRPSRIEAYRSDYEQDYLKWRNELQAREK